MEIHLQSINMEEKPAANANATLCNTLLGEMNHRMMFEADLGVSNLETT